MTDKNADIVIPLDSQNIATAGLVGANLSEIGPLKWVDDAKQGFSDDTAGIEMMRQHYLDMMNPERLYTSAPLQEEYKRVQIEKAEQFLVHDGYKIIERGEIAPSLFR
jgi:hypothetical protein